MSKIMYNKNCLERKTDTLTYSTLKLYTIVITVNKNYKLTLKEKQQEKTNQDETTSLLSKAKCWKTQYIRPNNWKGSF